MTYRTRSNELDNDVLVGRMFRAARQERPHVDAEAAAERAASRAALSPRRAFQARSARYRAAAIGAVAAAMTLAMGGVYVVKQRAERAAQNAAADQRQADLERQIQAAKDDALQHGAFPDVAIANATAELRDAKDDAARARAQHDLDQAMEFSRELAQRRSQAKSGTSATPASPRPPPCTCNKMDPLCGCTP